MNTLDAIDNLLSKCVKRFGKRVNCFRYNALLSSTQLLVYRNSPFGLSLQPYIGPPPRNKDYVISPETYLRHLYRLKKADFDLSVRKLRISKALLKHTDTNGTNAGCRTAGGGNGTTCSLQPEPSEPAEPTDPSNRPSVRPSST